VCVRVYYILHTHTHTRTHAHKQVATFAGIFEKEAYSVGDKIPLSLVLEGSLMEPIRLSSILVTFSDDRYSVLLHQQGEDVGEGGGWEGVGGVGGGHARKCVHKVAMEMLELKVGSPSFFSFEVPATKGSSALSVSEVTLHWGGGGGDRNIRIPAK
jgi:hypothetical protein